MTTDTRLGALEGRADEQAAAIADLRAGQREIVSTINSRFEDMNSRIDGVNSRIDGVNSRIDGVDNSINNRIDRVESRIDSLNSRIDRVFLAMLGIGAAQVALLITLVVRS